jgi:hypothetical protein
MIPVTPDAIYNEAIYDVDSKVLAVIGKEKKESMHMVAKLNEWGDPQTMKIGKRINGKDYAEERKTLETFYEYYIESAEEIANFIKLVAVNADSFDFDQYMKAVTDAPKTGNLISSL